MVQRDFIILCQFCLSYTVPFANIAREYFITYFQLFPPIFFKESVIETLCFAISVTTKKLNLNYSNISESVKFPYYDQSIVNVAGKIPLSRILNLILSVLTNLYFTAYFLSRYLTRSTIENYIKSISNEISSDSIGKQFIAYLSQIEPELDSKERAKDNLFLEWIKQPKKFSKNISFHSSKVLSNKKD